MNKYKNKCKTIHINCDSIYSIKSHVIIICNIDIMYR